MSNRYRVLISAYSCRPGYGSESGIGWNLALQMARYHETTVLTRPSNEPPIERAVESLPEDAAAPRFVYFDHSRAATLSKRWRVPGSSWWRYCDWQKRARREVARLQKEFQFDLLHQSDLGDLSFGAGRVGPRHPNHLGADYWKCSNTPASAALALARGTRA